MAINIALIILGVIIAGLIGLVLGEKLQGKTCEVCDGTGVVYGNMICPSCHGTGKENWF